MKTYKSMIDEYLSKYGHIPSDKEEIIRYLEQHLHFTEKDYEKLEREEEIAQSIPWETLKIILPVIPKPSPRPRYSNFTKSFYVSGAAENKKLFKYYVNDIYHILYTQVHFHLDSYIPTPVSSMNRIEIMRAERGTICAMSNPDFDNLAKTYSDMMQGILLLNDNIVTVGNSRKFYSIKPRVEIIIEYQKGFDSRFNKKKMTNSTRYKEYVEVGNVIEVYQDGW